MANEDAEAEAVEKEAEASPSDSETALTESEERDQRWCDEGTPRRPPDPAAAATRRLRRLRMGAKQPLSCLADGARCPEMPLLLVTAVEGRRELLETIRAEGDGASGVAKTAAARGAISQPRTERRSNEEERCVA